MRYREACRILGVQPNTTPEEARAKYITLAHSAHPDLGGTRDRWDELQDAYRSVLEDLKQPRRCSVCGGAGTITKVLRAPQRCATCNGTGQLSVMWRRPQHCDACDGTGQRVVMRRGRLTTIACDQCQKE